jgi:hypothetical protein
MIDWKNMNNAEIRMKIASMEKEYDAIKMKINNLLTELDNIDMEYNKGVKELNQRSK